MSEVINHKGTDCKYKSIICQEGYCQDCQVGLDFQGHERTMGRLHGSITPRWLEEYEKEQESKLSILRRQIRVKRDDAFSQAVSGSREHKVTMLAMVNAYDVCLKLIREII